MGSARWVLPWLALAAAVQQFECDEMQGFYFSKPVPEREATALFQTGISNWRKAGLETTIKS